MSNDALGWKGKKLRHTDGRTGVIVREYAGFCFVSLTIRVDGTDGIEAIQLNSDGPDSGARGWNWMYAGPGQAEAWAPLGDHNAR